MKRALQIVSLVTLITVVAAMVAQVLTVTQGITYDSNGQPVNPSTLTLIVTVLGVAGMVSLPLTAVDGVLGILVTGLEQRSMPGSSRVWSLARWRSWASL
jgi:uncharacterized membrane protein